MRKTTLQTIGGLDQFGRTVSDDAAIGQAIVRHHLRNVLIPRTVTIPFEPLDLRGGARHLLKWLALLRTEGVATYLSIVLLWHPLLWSCLTLLVGALLFGFQSFTFPAALALLAVSLLTEGRALSSSTGASMVFQQPGFSPGCSPMNWWPFPSSF